MSATPIVINTHAPARPIKVAILALLLLMGGVFAWIYVVPYFLHYGPQRFDVYWARRYGLLLHISGGVVALLIGPWQFSKRLRQRNLQLHRNLGRSYLIAIALGALGSIYLALTTTFGVAWGISLLALASAWLTTSGMAYFLIRRGQVRLHREWMVRSYIVTFGFVSFRLLNDHVPHSLVQPGLGTAIMWVWLCWTLPMLAYEAILGIRQTASSSVPRVSAKR